jgi:succinate dehydrogenase / fumarate reductase flavoprotein subunit
MQQKIVSLQQEDFAETGDYESKIKVFAELTITEILKTDGKVSGVLGYWRESGEFVVFEAPAVVLATGGIGKSFKVTSNSWEGTGDGHALALKAGGNLMHMEFIQFHPTGMVWPLSVKGILVTESVRGDGGVLRNSDGKRFMFDYIPPVFVKQYADTEEEADRWYTDPDNNRRPPELLPRDEVARAINTEVKAGRGSPHGGVFLDVSTRLAPEVIKARLPSMWHQFKELADVDITKQAMEVGPTCHYVMGGVQVDPDSGAATGVPGLFAAGEVAGGMHGSNRLGGNSLSDLLVFGRRAGVGASEYVNALATKPKLGQAEIDRALASALAPFKGDSKENAYAVHYELQQMMNDLVGIIRVGAEMREAIEKLEAMKERAKHVSVMGDTKFNPGWHIALDLMNMLLVSEAVAKSAMEREESRGGHTRDDFPTMDPNWRAIHVITSWDGSKVKTERQSLPPMPKELAELFDVEELKKYLLPEELAQLGMGGN